MTELADFLVWDFDPTILHLGPLQIRYYGLLFVAVFISGYLLFRWQLRRIGVEDDKTDRFLLWAIFAVVIGARLGHCFFYEPAYYLEKPIRILKVWRGGLASHGATVGLVFILWLFAKTYRYPVGEIIDRFAMSATSGAILVRIGNFLNGEIVGRVTDVPWAIRFVRYLDRGANPRHPAQLYEALWGIVVFVVLFLVDRKLKEQRPRWLLTGLFFGLLFTGRFFIEFTKEYEGIDPSSFLTMGQYLSILPALAGIGLVAYALARPTFWQPTLRVERSVSMSNPEFEKVAKIIDGFRDEAIRLETLLTRLPAIDPRSEAGAKGEADKAEALKRYLAEQGFPAVEEIRAPDDQVPGKYRPNLICRIPGQGTPGTIWIMSHLDVVPPGDLSKWHSDPWTVKVDGDKVIGRGVEDNQQGIVASVLATLGLQKAGLKPKRDVGLLFVADEETGSGFGIDYVIKNANPFKKGDLILVPDGGAKDGSEIEVAEKGILWTKFKVTGKQCHASMPDSGNNAFSAMSHLVVRLEKLRELFPAEDPVYAPPRSTFEPTKHEANVPSINIIPGEEVFCLDARVLPEYKLDDVIAKLEEIARSIEREFKVQVEIAFPQRADPAPPTSTKSTVVTKMMEAVKAVYNVAPKAIGIGGGTVAAVIRKAGFDAVVWSRMDETMHGPDEYALVSNLIGDAKVFAWLMLAE